MTATNVLLLKVIVFGRNTLAQLAELPRFATPTSPANRSGTPRGEPRLPRRLLVSSALWHCTTHRLLERGGSQLRRRNDGETQTSYIRRGIYVGVTLIIAKSQ